jgi:O-antigen/teichoic acid export membrane protein
MTTPDAATAAPGSPVTTSARSRFVFTVGMNLARTGISFATGMLAARWLGPGLYGSMAFLLGTFAGVRALLDMGSAAGFFTFLSQEARSWRFVRGFFLWQAIQFALPMIVIGLLFPSEWIVSIWRGESRTLVLLACAAAFMQGSVWPAVQQACESQRRTYLAQGVGVAVVVVHLIAVAAFWYFGALGLAAILAAIAIEYLIAGVVVLRRLAFTGSDAGEDARTIIGKYVTYCLPLVPFSMLSFAGEFADRWLLQRHGGGVQQAYYAIGAQLASIALIATSSILNIFWKEIAEAHHRGDRERTRVLYRRVSRLLFAVGAAVAGLLLPWSAEVLRLLLGPEFVGGAPALMIMLLYPVHQTMGQVGATMMYATEQVRTHVLIGGAMMVVGLVVAYLVLAPPDSVVPGLGLASTGLAVKMVGVQIVGVNVLAYALARINRWPYEWVYQPVVIGVCVGLGWLVREGVLATLPASTPVMVELALAGVLYAILLAGALVLRPALAGLSRTELAADYAALRRFVTRRAVR